MLKTGQNTLTERHLAFIDSYHICKDTIRVNLPLVQKFRYVLVAQEKLTRWVEGQATKLPRAQLAIKFLRDTIVDEHETSQIITL